MKRLRDSIKKLKNSNDMVSEIVGTILILGITIAVISTLYTVVLAYPSPENSTFVDLVGTVEGDLIIIEHRGGDALGFGTKVKITIDDETSEFTIDEENYLDPEAKMNNRWNVGERLEYQFIYSLDYSEAEITVIDERNTIILNGILDIIPVCDIGVMVDGEGGSGALCFTVTAINYRSDIDTVEASIEITIPDSLLYTGHTASSGTYTDHGGGGIWLIEEFSAGDSIILELYMMGELNDRPIIAELLSSVPSDINPENNIGMYPQE